jgi:hypothetical protein
MIADLRLSIDDCKKIAPSALVSIGNQQFAQAWD